MKRTLLALCAAAILAISAPSVTAERAVASFTPTKGGVNLALAGEDDPDYPDVDDDTVAGAGARRGKDKHGKPLREPWKVLQSLPNVRIFEDLVREGRLRHLLGTNGKHVTLIVPSDDAFSSLAVHEMLELDADEKKRQRFVLHAQINGAHTAEDLVRMGRVSTGVSLKKNGEETVFYTFKKDVSGDIEVEDSQHHKAHFVTHNPLHRAHTMYNIETTFGYIHVVDNVLPLPDYLKAPNPTAMSLKAAAGDGDEPDFDQETKIFGELSAASGFGDYLLETSKREGKVTILVPNNAAFGKLGLWGMKALADYPEVFMKQMYYMSIPGAHTASELSKKGASHTLLSIRNRNYYKHMLAFGDHKGKTIALGSEGVQATFVDGLHDIKTDFGVVHVVDTVLPVPPGPRGPGGLRAEKVSDDFKTAVERVPEEDVLAAFGVNLKVAEREEEQMPEPFFWLM